MDQSWELRFNDPRSVSQLPSQMRGNINPAIGSEQRFQGERAPEAKPDVEPFLSPAFLVPLIT